jgi:hypothetical protein
MGLANSIPTFCETTLFSHNTFGVHWGCGVLTARRVRHITALSSMVRHAWRMIMKRSKLLVIIGRSIYPGL